MGAISVGLTPECEMAVREFAEAKGWSVSSVVEGVLRAWIAAGKPDVPLKGRKIRVSRADREAGIDDGYWEESDSAREERRLERLHDEAEAQVILDRAAQSYMQEPWYTRKKPGEA